MIASDIHGSAYYCRKMLDAYKREGADRLLLLGDILYHGPRNDGRTIFASHGHHHNPKNPPMLKKGDILLNGHTHIPANEDMGDFIYMNPGSVSIPKEGSAHGYMICESGEFTWKDLEGNIVGI